MSFLKEFKEFAMRGNVVDLAVAVVIGAAFGKIISSLVDGIVMPLIGLIIGGVNIAGESLTVGHAVIKWGAFLQTIIDFTLIAFSIFLAVKFINLLRKKEEEQEPKLTPVEVLLTEIRDLMKERK
ncbi:large-conductance mechanosensitive channel protein MscL [Legionella quateirensis]|uniref:Large-conductance mechanosensitive channel n=1 Tax=Legionella quateirensis TaxID=45072 RepID=A0A378L0D4_9GAMM|nr:large-conductance mechanosensitive channel protein MscL [Legionella quateirensis]KTD51206.1 large conductance mechanosensitive channel [Legionella quateirensis]STY17550.1 large conductance mechanosensitive channel, MscL family [Legionella quateirensis]